MPMYHLRVVIILSKSQDRQKELEIFFVISLKLSGCGGYLSHSLAVHEYARADELKRAKQRVR